MLTFLAGPFLVKDGRQEVFSFLLGLAISDLKKKVSPILT